MQEFNVHISLECFKNGFGEIYVRFGDYFFPGNKWTDFSENLLSWWAEEFTKLLTARQSKVKCGFMDGAVRLDIEAIDEKTWRIQCIREYANSEESELEYKINPIQASESLLKAISLMLNLFHDKGDRKAFNFLNERKQNLVLAIQKKTANAS